VNRLHAKEYQEAGITDPDLIASYEVCRELNASHGKTYYLATLLLPPGKRPYVHALYGFARYADEIVDDLDSTLSDQEKANWLKTWVKRLWPMSKAVYQMTRCAALLCILFDAGIFRSIYSTLFCIQ